MEMTVSILIKWGERGVATMILTIHFNTWKKNAGMKATVFGKHLEARMNNNQHRIVKTKSH